MLPTLDDIEAAARTVYAAMPATPQYCWPLLGECLGTEIWIKHENHTPVGAFKLRGGLVYFAHLVGDSAIRGVVSATRGNHGQSVGLAARRHGLAARIVVPYGNSSEKNAAMRALGVELVEHGEDFQAAREYASRLASELGWHLLPSFHPLLVAGVATYALELLRAVGDLATVYVPIGLGSGICGMVAARDALGLQTEVVGVVSAHARAYALSFADRQAREAPVTTRLADGMACRTPQPEALEVIWRGVDRIVEVSDAEVAEAIRLIFSCTHNAAEGAGAAAVAAALQEKSRLAGRRIAAVLSGGNIDRTLFAEVLRGCEFFTSAPQSARPDADASRGAKYPECMFGLAVRPESSPFPRLSPDYPSICGTADVPVPRPTSSGARVAARIRLCARANRSATPLTLFSPRTTRRFRPRLRASALTHSAVAARSL
jgi:threonine dehydratase